MLPLSLDVTIPGCPTVWPSSRGLSLTINSQGHLIQQTLLYGTSLTQFVMCRKNLFHSHSDRVFPSGNKLMVMCVRVTGMALQLIIAATLFPADFGGDWFVWIQNKALSLRAVIVSLLSPLANPCTVPILTPWSPTWSLSLHYGQVLVLIWTKVQVTFFNLFNLMSLNPL